MITNNQKTRAPVHVFVAAKTLGHFCDWDVSNLKMHKLLYIAHMAYMGENDGGLLIKTPFEAWDYGPVQPELYHKLKRYGAQNVEDIFWTDPRLEEETSEYKIIKQTATLKALSGAQLIGITHQEGRAWSRVYEPDRLDINIPDEYILADYKHWNNKHRDR